MSIPSHTIVSQVLADIKVVAAKVNVDYRYLAATAYERPKRGSGGGGKSAGHNDVASALAGTGPVRREVETAAHAVFEALGAMNRAQAALGRVGDALDKGQTVEPDREVSTRERLADQGDLKRALAAQKRRTHRAQESGDWSEVVGG